MKMGLKLWPVGIVAAHDEALPDSLFELAQQAFGYGLKMLKRLLRHAAFRMARFVTLESVIRSTARKHMNHRMLFAQFIKTEIEEASALPVDNSNAQGRLSSERSCQRLQLKTGLKIDVSGPEMRRQFVFFPEILRGAGKNRFSLPIAAKVGRQIK